MKKLDFRVCVLSSAMFLGCIVTNAMNAQAAEPVSALPAPAAKAGPGLWYGWQSLIVAGSSTVLTLGGVFTSQKTIIGVGLPGLFFGGPIVHFSHAKVERGFGVLGINTLFALGGGFAGSAIACPEKCRSTDVFGLGGFGGFMIGSLVGLLAANALDVTAFAYDENKQTGLAKQPQFPFTLMPQFSLGEERKIFGLSGTF